MSAAAMRSDTHPLTWRLGQGRPYTALADYEALEGYVALRKALRDELSAEPSTSSTQLYEQILNGDWLLGSQSTPPGSKLSVQPVQMVPSHNLPAPLTSFIGRKREVIEVSELLKNHRLVSLTGAGGIGKTRLALQVGMQAQADFEDGAWLVELAPLSDPALVALTVAQIFGLREIPNIPILDTLSSYLRNKQVLLILDNCEHLLVACASMAETLLKNCPRLQLLATSREILNVPGESVYYLSSLPIPPSGQALPVEQMAQFEAVQLFIERASQSMTGFTLNDTNARAVFTICQRLDGIPLALELAAARTRVISVHQISIRLDDVFQLLVGGARAAQPRQQTLQAAIDWSYNLLSSKEQIVFQRLSAFARGWTIEAAEAVCAGNGIELNEVMNLLAELVDKSLVIMTTEQGGGEKNCTESRFHMLEVIRLYARDRLQKSESEIDIRDRHLCYYVALSEQKELLVRGPRQIECLHWLKTEMDNLRLALDWSLDSRVLEGLRLASALKWFWHLPSNNLEGRQWLEKLLAIEAQGRGSQPLSLGAQSDDYLLAWSRSIDALDLNYFITGNPSTLFTSAQWLERLAENVELCRKMGEKASRELARALTSYGFAMRSDTLLEEGLNLCREKGYRFEEAEILYCLYWVMTTGKGNIEKGQDCIDESLKICLAIQDNEGIATRMWMAGQLAHLKGEFDKATRLIQEAQVYYQKVGNYIALHNIYYK